MSKPFRLRIKVVNLSKRRPEREVPVTLVELVNNGALIDAPRDELQQGDPIRFSIETEGFPEEIRASLTGLVARVTIDPQKTEGDTIEVRLDKIDPKLWHALRAGIEGRQDEVEKVFLALKGSE